MSFDIYGNNLARGHCEVHPHVAEEYPCSVCQMDSQYRHDAQASQHATWRLQDENEKLEARVAELEAKVAELEQANKWISVEDELPKETGRYWCYVKCVGDLCFYFEQDNCSFNVHEKRWHSELWANKSEYVTHWMPLPKPPKDGDL